MMAPCKDCPDRATLCHSTCERYLAFKKTINELREKEQRYRNENIIIRRGRRKT